MTQITNAGASAPPRSGGAPAADGTHFEAALDATLEGEAPEAEPVTWGSTAQRTEFLLHPDALMSSGWISLDPLPRGPEFPTETCAEAAEAGEAVCDLDEPGDRWWGDLPVDALVSTEAPPPGLPAPASAWHLADVTSSPSPTEDHGGGVPAGGAAPAVPLVRPPVVATLAAEAPLVDQPAVEASAGQPEFQSQLDTAAEVSRPSVRGSAPDARGTAHGVGTAQPSQLDVVPVSAPDIVTVEGQAPATSVAATIETEDAAGAHIVRERRTAAWVPGGGADGIRSRQQQETAPHSQADTAGQRDTRQPDVRSASLAPGIVRARMTADLASSPALFQVAVSSPTAITPPATITPAPAVPVVHAALDGDIENLRNLVQAMRVTAKNGGWEATVRLRPEHLGEVTIALRLNGNTVSAVVNAEAPGVRQWLLAQEDAVRAGLAEQGLSLDKFLVDRDGRQTPDEREESAPERRRGARRSAQAATRFEIVV